MVKAYSGIKQGWTVFLYVVIMSGLFYYYRPDYYIVDTFFIAVLITFPITWRINASVKSLRFIWPTIALTIFTILLPTNFGVFSVILFSGLLVAEQLIGKLSLLTIFHAMLLSPLFKYAIGIISFPLRLQISEVISFLLTGIGSDAVITGNLITLGDSEFLVDTACMGLHLIGYSLLFAIIIMPFIEKKKGEIGFIKITLLLILIVILNLIGNIIRGLTLIVFRIMPEYWFHDAVGLLVLLLYVLIPFYFIASKVICHVPVKIKKERILPGNIKYIVLLCCTTITIFLCQRLPEIDPVILSENYLTLEGYETEQVTPDVTKLWNDETLIYVKAPIPPYRTDHNPMICWKGSGYSFSKVDHFKLGGHHVIYSELVKGKEKLYTTWWFQSDKSIAVDQWGWRRKSIKTGESFYLVNITCNSMETLKEKSLGIMREELFGSIK